MLQFTSQPTRGYHYNNVNSHLQSWSLLSGCGRRGITAGGKEGVKCRLGEPGAEVPSGATGIEIPEEPGNCGFSATSMYVFFSFFFFLPPDSD